MYRKKLGRWGLAKNLRRKEVIDILNRQSQKGCTNTVDGLSDGIAHGPQFQPVRIKQYLRRNRTVIERLHNEPISRFNQAPAGQLQDSEVLLRRLRTYIDSSISSGLWTLGPDGRCQSRHGSRGEEILLEAWGRFDTVIRFLSRSEDIAIFRILDPAFEGLHLVTVEETPRAFSFLSSALLSLHRYGRGDLVNVTLQYLCKTSRETLGASHHLTKIWEMVSKLNSEEGAALMGAMDVTFSALSAELKARLGSSNPFFASVCTDHFDAIICTKGELEKDVFLCQALSNFEAWQVPELQIRHQVTQRNLKCLDGKFDEAIQEAQSLIMSSTQNPVPRIWKYQSLGYIYRKQGKLQSALTWFTFAFNIAMEEVVAFSEEHWVQPILINLEDLSRQLGQHSQATWYKTLRGDRILRLVGQRAEPNPLPLPIRRYDPFENDAWFSGC